MNPLVEPLNRFGLRLLDALRREQPDRNVVISPASVALALLLAGYGAAGETAAEIDRTVGIAGLPNEERDAAVAGIVAALNPGSHDLTLDLATAIFGALSTRFLPSFVADAGRIFSARLTSLDLSSTAALEAINAWVRERTRGTIRSILDQPLPPDAALVLANALYFYGRWVAPFRPEYTSDRPFTTPAGPIDVPMMRQGGWFSYLETDTLQAVRLPYEPDGSVVMEVFLPKSSQSSPTSLDIDPGLLTSSTDLFERRQGSVLLPKFHTEFNTSLVPALKSLDLTRIFAPGADFSRMLLSDRPAFFSDVIHKTFVAVDEAGTEAAAVTAMVMRAGAAFMPPAIPPFYFEANRPFRFVIRHQDSGTVLFIGDIYSPG